MALDAIGLRLVPAALLRVWKYYGLILALDPVAADATGLRIIVKIGYDKDSFVR